MLYNTIIYYKYKCTIIVIVSATSSWHEGGGAVQKSGAMLAQSSARGKRSGGHSLCPLLTLAPVYPPSTEY